MDAGWFMDIAPYASRKDGFTFQKAARALAGPLNATFDRYSSWSRRQCAGKCSRAVGLLKLPSHEIHASSFHEAGLLHI